ncbi:hypothetical protein YC2023_083932 [Brassica napus]
MIVTIFNSTVNERSLASGIHALSGTVTRSLRTFFAVRATEERENGFEDFCLHQLSLLGDHSPFFLLKRL